MKQPTRPRVMRGTHDRRGIFHAQERDPLRRRDLLCAGCMAVAFALSPVPAMAHVPDAEGPSVVEAARLAHPLQGPILRVLQERHALEECAPECPAPEAPE